LLVSGPAPSIPKANGDSEFDLRKYNPDALEGKGTNIIVLLVKHY